MPNLLDPNNLRADPVGCRLDPFCVFNSMVGDTSKFNAKNVGQASLRSLSNYTQYYSGEMWSSSIHH